jgi:GT2 family glycosyltransferase
MTVRPIVSVVVPHLNQPGPLAACLDSLARQSTPREAFEVIVADNGSAVSPEAVVGRLEGACLVRESRPGPGPARNRGVAESRGELLAFIDADCVAEPGWLEAIVRRLRESDDRIVVGGEVRIALREPGRPTAIEAYESVFAFRQRDYIEKKGFSGTGNLAVRRRDFDAIGPFGGISIAEDRDWGRRARALGYRVVFAPEMIVEHPARASFGDLFVKWDRQIRHDLEERRRAGGSRGGWLLRALAVAASPLIDVARVARSRRIEGARAKLLAMAGLFPVRLYRAGRMVQLALAARPVEDGRGWNRGTP